MMQPILYQMRWILLCVAFLLALTACQRGAALSPTAAPRDTLVPDLLVATTTARTSQAQALLQQALAARLIGDDNRVAVELNTLLESYPGAPEARAARFYLAENIARRDQWSAAVEALQAFIAMPEQDEWTARALFWLARSYEEVGDWQSAIATYARYRDLETPLEPYAAIRQAAQFQATGQLDEAAQAYAHGAAMDISRGERAGSYEKAIALRRQLGHDHLALQLYSELLALAQQPGYRARILSEAAALAQSQNQPDQARAWLIEIVSTLPTTPQAPGAASQLLAANDPELTSAAAARIFFSNEQYTTALPLFDAAIAQALATGTDDDDLLDLQRLRGLTLRALGYFPEALDALEAAASARPDSEPGRQAQLDWIQTVGQSGEVQRAADTYRHYADTYADDPRAPIALDRAAQLLDRLGNNWEAAQVRVELGQRYPQHSLSAAALHNAGLYFFRMGHWGNAQYAWQILAEQRQGYVQARGAYWAARAAQQQQQDEHARHLFTIAYSAAPDSYYSARAADVLALTMTPTLALDAPLTKADWNELETWARDGWPPAETEDDQATRAEPSPPVADTEAGDYRTYVRRAIELERVGLWNNAIAEWNSARTIAGNDPLQLIHVARLAHEHTVPYIALKAAEQLAALAPENAAPPPTTLRRLIFPTPYVDLVRAETGAQGIDPRLFYALLRQESLFNPGATSWAGARGLGQVMPTTGQGIAQRLEVPDFHVDDLYRPHVSIRFGAFYIGQQIQGMQGSIHGGLAAYNGGAGNAQRWAGGTFVADPDLYIEGIDYPETKGYVNLVYGYYGAYRQLYFLPEE